MARVLLIGNFTNNQNGDSMRIKSIIAAFALSAASLTAAHATVLNFDEIGIPGGVTAPGLSTQGFRMSDNTDVVDITDSIWKGFGPAYSGRYSALNDWHGDIVLTKVDGSLFSFQGMYIKSWGGFNDGGDSTVTAYLGDTVVGSYAFTLSGNWQNVAGNLSGIDRLVVSAGSAFLLDDVTVDGAANVPEPASLALLGLGALAAGTVRRRRQ